MSLSGNGHTGPKNIKKTRKTRKQSKRKSGVVYCYEVIKRELNRRLTYECWCDERLKAKAEGCTRLAYWVVRGTGTPKDRDEVNGREVCSDV